MWKRRIILSGTIYFQLNYSKLETILIETLQIKSKDKIVRLFEMKTLKIKSKDKIVRLF